MTHFVVTCLLLLWLRCSRDKSFVVRGSIAFSLAGLPLCPEFEILARDAGGTQ
jgi:hypothetical protein